MNTLIKSNWFKVGLGLLCTWIAIKLILSVVDLRDDAIDFKDEAADTKYATLVTELERSQAQVKALEKQLLTKESVIGGLNRATGRLSAARNELEQELQVLRLQRQATVDELARYKQNYSQEALKDVEAVERTTNATISDLMREYESITTEAARSTAGGNREN